jgi:hypothetical protein
VAEDNQNQYVVAFLSMLTAQKVFQEIHVEFLLVGHNHEDIDIYFKYLFTQLKIMNKFVLVDLMKTFTKSQFSFFYISFKMLLNSNISNKKSFSIWSITNSVLETQ